MQKQMQQYQKMQKQQAKQTKAKTKKGQDPPQQQQGQAGGPFPGLQATQNPATRPSTSRRKKARGKTKAVLDTLADPATTPKPVVTRPADSTKTKASPRAAATPTPR